MLYRVLLDLTTAVTIYYDTPYLVSSTNGKELCH
jgi:hypothetical protein